MLDLNIYRKSKTPVYLQIKEGLVTLILSKELEPGQKLPSERALATELDVHRNTVVKAYGELVRAGFVKSSREKPRGYFVNEVDGEISFLNKYFQREQSEEQKKSRYKRIKDLMNEAKDDPDVISFMETTGKARWQQQGIEDVQNVLREQAKRFKKKESTDQSIVLKENIVKFRSKDNMFLGVKNIELAESYDRAIDYILDLFLQKGDCIIAGEPLVESFYNQCKKRGIEIVTISVGVDGVDFKNLEKLISEYNPKFIYTTPNYQNPTGRTMSLEKRQQFVELAHRRGIPIVEDDRLREIRFTNNSLPSIYSLDNSRCVIHLGSFYTTIPHVTKSCYIVAPYDVAAKISTLREEDETLVTNFEHFLINQYLETDLYQGEIDYLRSFYRRKLNFICEYLERLKDYGVSYRKPEGGLSVWCQLDGIDSEKLFYKCLEKKVIIYPSSYFRYSNLKYRNCFKLSLNNLTDEQVALGMKRIKEAIRELKEEY